MGRLRSRLERLEREAEGELLFVSKKDGTVKRFPKSTLQESIMTNMKRLRGEDVPRNPLGVAAAGSPDPEWRRSLYSAAWTEIVVPVEDLSEQAPATRGLRLLAWAGSPRVRCTDARERPGRARRWRDPRTG